MTRRDLLDDHMDDFGAQLHRAAASKPRRDGLRRQWVRPAIGIGGLVGIGATVAAVTLFPVAGGKVDVVSEAKAALSESGEIVHLVLGQTNTQLDSGPGRPILASDREAFLRSRACLDPDQTTSLWTATTGPSRYRVAMKNYRCNVQVNLRQVIEPGAEEQSGYADGAYQQYYPGQKLLLRTTNLVPSDDNLVELSPSQLGLVDGLAGESDPFRDPLDRVRKLLGSGELRDAGRFTGPDGRALWRLRGNVVRDYSYRENGEMKDVKLRIAAEYVVDAKSFAPVSFSTSTREYNEGKPGSAYANTVEFLKYERLPLNAETEKLLRIQPAEGTRTVSLTSRQIRKIYRGPTHGSAEDKVALAKAEAVASRNQAEADALVEAKIRSEERTGTPPATTP